ncbi:MAG TPA: hypothetical protein VFU65_01735 [Actinocrinis sp.]|nr:hypothetical protein [Actinocrinis sp.]
MTTETINSLSPGLPPATTEAVNSNDVRRFVYAWFTMFEHRVPTERLTRHLADDRPILLSFPDAEPLRDAGQFAAWYGQLLGNTAWNFHELTNVTVRAEEGGSYQVGFDVDWQGGVTEDSSWPTNLPERRFRFALRQKWRVITRPGNVLENPLSIVELAVEQR